MFVMAGAALDQAIEPEASVGWLPSIEAPFEWGELAAGLQERWRREEKLQQFLIQAAQVGAPQPTNARGCWRH
jgi:hypothetical protein